MFEEPVQSAYYIVVIGGALLLAVIAKWIIMTYRRDRLVGKQWRQTNARLERLEKD